MTTTPVDQLAYRNTGTACSSSAKAPTKLVVTNAGSAKGTYLPTWNGHGDLLALWRQEPDGTPALAASVTYGTRGSTVNAERGFPARSVPESRARRRSA